MTGKIMTNTVEENFPSSSKRYHFLYTSCSFIGSIAYVKHTIIIQTVQKSFKTYKNHSNSKKQPKYYTGKQHLLEKQTGRTKKTSRKNTSVMTDSESVPSNYFPSKACAVSLT